MRNVLFVCLALVACGDGDDNGTGELADAPIAPDGSSVDAPSELPPLEPVTLTVTKNGLPVPGVRAYFVNPDNSLAANVLTDDTGKASARVIEGGSVTALDPFDTDVDVHDLRTFAGVKPGDDLALTFSDDSNGGEELNVTVVVPVPVSGASSYQILTTCGSGSISPALDLADSESGSISLSGCANGLADFVVIASGDDERPPQALYHRGLAVSDGGEVHLEADGYGDLTTAEFNYTGLPSNAGNVRVLHTLSSDRGSFASFDEQAGVVDGAATIQIEEPNLAGAGATGLIETQVSMFGLHSMFDSGNGATPFTVDASGVLLRDFFSFPTYNKTSKEMFWEEEIDGVEADFTFAQIRVDRFLDMAPGLVPAAPPGSWTWSISAPYREGKLAFPKLPTDQGDWAPALSDVVDIDTLTNVKLPGGYDAIRARVHDIGDRSDLVAAPTDRVVLVDVRRPAAVRQTAVTGRKSGLSRGGFTLRTR